MLNNNKQQPQQQRINININTLTPVTCPNCKGIVFQTGLTTFRRLSSVQSPTGQEQLIAINLIKCSTCEHLFLVENNTLTPVSLKEFKKL